MWQCCAASPFRMPILLLTAQSRSGGSPASRGGKQGTKDVLQQTPFTSAAYKLLDYKVASGGVASSVCKRSGVFGALWSVARGGHG